MIQKTIPNDRSSLVYSYKQDAHLVASKPLLVFYYMEKELIGFKRAQYIYAKRTWIDWDGFEIKKEKFIGWYDVDYLL